MTVGLFLLQSIDRRLVTHPRASEVGTATSMQEDRPQIGPNMFLFGYVFELNTAVDRPRLLYTTFIYAACHRPRRATPAR